MKHLRQATALMIALLLIGGLLTACVSPLTTGAQAKPSATAGPTSTAGSTTTAGPTSTAPVTQTTVATTFATTGTSAAPLKEATIKVYFPGDRPAGAKLVWDTIATTFKKELNATYDINWIPFGEYVSKLLVLSLSNDKWDLNFDGNWLAYPQMANKGAYLALNDLLPQYAPDLYQFYKSGNALKAATVNGKIICLPWTMEMNGRPYVYWRGDLYKAEENSIKTFEDLNKMLYEMKDKLPADNPAFHYGNESELLNAMATKHELDAMGNFHQFYVDMNDKSCKLIALETTEAFKEAVTLAKKWYDDGIIPKNAMTDKTDWNAAYNLQGKPFSNFSSHEWTHVNMSPLWLENKWIRSRSLFYPDKKYPNRSFLSNVMCINKNAANPERALMFMNKVQTSREMYDLIQYGVLDKTYKLKGEEVISDETLPKDQGYLGWLAPWALWKPQFMRPDGTYPEGFWEEEAKFSKIAINVPSMVEGLFIDSESIKNDIAKRDQIWTEVAKPMLFGLTQNIDAEIADLQTKLKAANLDNVMASIQKQIDAWLAAGK